MSTIPTAIAFIDVITARRQWTRDTWSQLFSCSPHYAPPHCSSAAIALSIVREFLDDVPADLFPAKVRNSVVERQVQFLGGRLCSEYSLRKLGVTHVRVEQGPQGRPQWPSAHSGSITHTKAMAFAVVGAISTATHIGIDSEEILDASSAPAVEAVCCTDKERDSLAKSGEARSLSATVIFAAKESMYKATSELTDVMMDFDEVEVSDIDLKNGTFLIAPVLGAQLFSVMNRTVGYVRVLGRLVHASVVLQQADLQSSGIGASLRPMSGKGNS